MSRPRLHKSSIVVGLIVALLLVLIEVPGRVVSGYGYTNLSKVFEHGWPWIYLRRETYKRAPPQFVKSSDARRVAQGLSIVTMPLDIRTDLPRWGVPWLSAENWRFWESDPEDDPPRWTFHGVNLIRNLAVALVVLGGIVAVWEIRRRRRARLLAFRFGLRGLLLAIAAAGGLLGWLTFLEREHGRERALIDKVFETSGPMEGTWFDIDQVCVAPNWLSALVGVRPFPSYFWRTSGVQIQPEYDYNAEFFCSQISQLKYVKRIALDGHPRIRFPFSALRNLKRLRTIEIWTYRIIDERDVDELAQLEQLEKIVVENKNEISPELLARLEAALPNCTIIESLDDW